MNFLEYSNLNHCNIIPQEEFEGLVHEVFGVIATNISKSLGPLGSSATILNGMMTEATKDGYSILNKYRFHNRYKKMIYNLIKAPCTRMNNTVGDGTTTAVVLADKIFNRYRENKDDFDKMYRLPRQFTKAWNSVIEDVTKRIIEEAKDIDPKDYDTIYNIAYVTSNGNHEISDAIASTYRDYDSPSIKMKNSPTNKSYISPIVGFDFQANLISPAYVRNEDMSVIEKDVAVMIFDHKIESDFLSSTIMPINDVMRAQNRKLIILAPAFDELMCQTIVEQYINAEYRQFSKINLIMASFPIRKLNKYQLSDLSVVLRAKVLTQDMASILMNEVEHMNHDVLIENIMEDEKCLVYRFIGTAAEASMSCESGSIFRVLDIESDQQYKDTMAQAKRELENIMAQTDYERQSYASKIYDAKARISQLEMRNFIYYIGADSDLQHQILEDSIEDVIKCVRSAIKYGVVPGCQLSILHGCAAEMRVIIDHDNPDRKEDDPIMVNGENQLRFYLISMLYEAVADVYRCVLEGPNKDGIIKLLPRWSSTTEEGKEELQKEASVKADEIINTSFQNGTVFDMETLTLNPSIITSAETDTMVLSAASELVKVLISGNQCIFLDSDIDESHTETIEAYV